MKSFVLYSYALLAFFRNEEGADGVEALLLSANENKIVLYLSIYNAGEVYYMAYRKNGEKMANKVWQTIQQFPIQLVQPDLDMIFKDAIAASLTILCKSTLLTGDNEFENLITEPGFKVKYLA